MAERALDLDDPGGRQAADLSSGSIFCWVIASFYFYCRDVALHPTIDG